MNPINPLTPSGLQQFLEVREKAIEYVSQRFLDIHPELLDIYGPRAVTACKEDIGYTLEFLRPALEFGMTHSFIDYLRWISGVLSSRGMSHQHVIEMITWLRNFFAEEFPDSTGSQIGDVLDYCCSSCQPQVDHTAGIDELMPAAWPEYSDLHSALLSGDVQAGLDTILKKLDEGHSLLEAELHLIQPALYQIGREWQQNQISVAKEHLATSTALTIIAQAFAHAEISPSLDKLVICACVEGNHHAVGLRIVADGFELKGWDTHFLGANVPAKDLIDYITVCHPDLLCLSVSMPDHLPTARATIANLRSSLGNLTPAIMLGGLAINSWPALATVIGADATAPDALIATNGQEIGL